MTEQRTDGRTFSFYKGMVLGANKCEYCKSGFRAKGDIFIEDTPLAEGEEDRKRLYHPDCMNAVLSDGPPRIAAGS